jgi:hypothetical protein
MSIDMKTWISDFWNRRETRILGVPTSPCVKWRMWLEGLQKPSRITNSKNVQTLSYHIMVIKITTNPINKAQSCQGKSGGKYLGARGPTNKFSGLSIQPLRDSPSAKTGWVMGKGRKEMVIRNHCSITPIHFWEYVQHAWVHLWPPAQ